MAHRYWESQTVINAIKSLQSSVMVSDVFDKQMIQVKRLLKNDYTGLVRPIFDFHIEAATTTFKIETDNDRLDEILVDWQTRILNSGVNMSVPRGLRGLTADHMRERLTSSFIVLRVLWEEQDFGVDNKWIMPTKMWLMDGQSIYQNKNVTDLRKQKFFVKDKNSKYGSTELRETQNESIIIRKPFNAWYDPIPTPYLVGRGVLFNALFKQLIINKQTSSLEQLIPLLLLMTAGANKLGEMGADITTDQMKEFKDSLIQSIKEHDYSGDIGKIIAVLNGDVKLEAMIPEFKKLTDASITDAPDKNILSGMGLIELSGFSNTRKEAMLNPQVFVTDVLDSVFDWADILKEVMFQMLEKNKKLHPRLANNKITVTPGKVKTFLTDNMKRLMALAHDKGSLPTEDYLEDVFDKSLESVLKRRKKEKENNVDEILSPRKTQNLDNQNQPKESDPDGNKEQQGKKPGTPEAKNYKTAEKAKIEAPYETIDDLPDSIKKSVSTAGQVIWLQTFNKALKDDKTEEEAIKIAWSAIKKAGYKKNNNGKWVKK